MGLIQERLKSEALQTAKDAGASDKTPDESRIAVGDTVWVREVGVKAIVLSLSEERQELEAQAGQTRLRIGLDKVDKVTTPDGQMPAMATPIRVEMAPRSVPLELDLRGKRADEVQSALDGYLNDASLAHQAEVRIIHGFGTGVLRKVVRESLATHPLVKSFRAGGRGEGGDGATVVQL